jgi:RNA polymerase sigma factor (sigma-70 family)
LTINDIDNDTGFINDLVSGDGVAFDTLYKATYNELRGFFGKKIEASLGTEDPEAAANLALETLDVVHEVVWKYKPQEDAKFSSWFFGVAVNIFKRYYDKHKDDPKLVQFDEAGPAEGSEEGQISAQDADESEQPFAAGGIRLYIDPEKELANKEREAERNRRVRRALDRLKEDQRSVIIKKEYHGMSYPEISQVTGLKESTLRSHHKRGLDALRNDQDIRDMMGRQVRGNDERRDS